MAKPGLRRALVALVLLGAGIIAVYLLDPSTPGADPDRSEGAEDAARLRREAKQDSDASAVQARLGDAPDGGVSEAKLSERQDYPMDLGDFDFESIRARTPRNLYWKMAVPTDDPVQLEARRQERERRNTQFGKVQSNTATVEEIREYYSYRRQLSEDYIEVVDLMLSEHGDELSERDVGLFELAISMHSANLREIPAKVDDALRRKEAYDRAKAAWKAQQVEDAQGAATESESKN